MHTSDSLNMPLDHIIDTKSYFLDTYIHIFVSVCMLVYMDIHAHVHMHIHTCKGSNTDEINR